MSAISTFNAGTEIFEPFFGINKFKLALSILPVCSFELTKNSPDNFSFVIFKLSSEIFRFASANLKPVTASLSFPFRPKSRVAKPDLKLYLLLKLAGAKALNKDGKGTLSALILISATDFSSILPSINRGALLIKILEFLISRILLSSFILILPFERTFPRFLTLTPPSFITTEPSEFHFLKLVLI